MFFFKKKAQPEQEVNTQDFLIDDTEKQKHIELMKQKREEMEKRVQQKVEEVTRLGKQAVAERIEYLEAEMYFRLWNTRYEEHKLEEIKLVEWLKEHADDVQSKFESDHFAIQFTKLNLLNFDMMKDEGVPPVIQEEEFYVPSEWLKKRIYHLFKKDIELEVLGHFEIDRIYHMAKDEGLLVFPHSQKEGA